MSLNLDVVSLHVEHENASRFSVGAHHLVKLFPCFSNQSNLGFSTLLVSAGQGVELVDAMKIVSSLPRGLLVAIWGGFRRGENVDASWPESLTVEM